MAHETLETLGEEMEEDIKQRTLDPAVGWDQIKTRCCQVGACANCSTRGAFRRVGSSQWIWTVGLS